MDYDKIILTREKQEPASKEKYVVTIKLKTFQYISCDACHSVNVN